jgi:hypothetical protein
MDAGVSEHASGSALYPAFDIDKADEWAMPSSLVRAWLFRPMQLARRQIESNKRITPNAAKQSLICRRAQRPD